MKEEDLLAELKEAAKEGKVSCAVAHQITMKNKVSLQRVGELLNQLQIKITKCQRGCF